MNPRTLLACAALLLATAAHAEPPADIDTAGFERQTAAALALRETRTLGTDAFLEMAARDDVVLLDTRSKWAYDRKHLAGAVHLNFSDFTAEKLAALIPSKDTPVLIYCNNNLEGDQVAFPRKIAPMALNIPTSVNLYGYGYRNVYEMGTLVRVDDPRFVFEGTDVVPAVQKRR